MDIPTIETERLLLRALRQDDLPGYIEMCSDPKTMQYIGTGKTLSPDESWRSMAYVIGHWSLRGYGFWAVEEKTTGAFVGRIGLYRPEGWPGLEVDWTLLKPARGKGYATEAAKASLEWGFQHTDTEELISLIIPENTPSIRVSQRIGQSFRREVSILDVKADLYSISRKEWQASL